jgi:DNA polymerase III epsilon subunit-like protein
MIVSFNGKAFDWPLLAGRFVMNGQPAPRPPPHLDLLHVARRIHGGRLERCNLKHLESHVLGYVREEDIEGALVAERYLQYLRSSEAALLGQVIEHNRWDVLSMAALLNLYGQPLPRLPAADLVSLARTLLRARSLDRAAVLLGHALHAGAGLDALCVRAELSRARGDHGGRAEDLEQAHDGLGDPKIRLELCKLYEHKLRRHERALQLLQLGLPEPEERSQRREQRLLKKLRKAAS